MLPEYDIHNKHWTSLSRFSQEDPHLSSLVQLKYQFKHFAWWDDRSLDFPGIYILTGGRQVGKSTSCKLLMKQALKDKRLPAQNIFYLPCDEINNFKTLSSTLRYLLDNVLGKEFFLILDEITYVEAWDRTINALADECRFRQGVCLLTSSDSNILHQAASRFPGRRGNAEKADLHLHPLSFKEYVTLMHTNPENSQDLQSLFDNYLITGGYLSAMNDCAMTGSIHFPTYKT